MYASQTKRLCVRGRSSDETTSRTTIQSQQSTTSDAIIHQQHLASPPPSLLKQPQTLITVGGNMTASTTGMTIADGNELTATHNMPLLIDALQTSSSSPPELQDYGLESSSSLADSETHNSEHELINKLATETLEEKTLELLLSIRNLITACNKKKDSLVNNRNFSKIINLIDDEKSSPSVKTQLALLICSVAKSGEHNIRVLNDFSVDDKIFNLILTSQDENLIEACLRCMRSIMSWPRVSRSSRLYELSQTACSPMNSCKQEKDTMVGVSNLSKIITYAKNTRSFIVQECIADIFAATCVRNKDQIILYNASALSCIVQLLESPYSRVIVAALSWLTHMCIRNNLICTEIIGLCCPSGTPVIERLIGLMSNDNCYEMQFLSARCYANIYKTLSKDLLKDDTRVVTHVLPTLIRMVHKDKPVYLRIKAAECIAQLIECETRLQSVASICDHLIESLANMLDYENHDSLRYLEDGLIGFCPVSCQQQQQSATSCFREELNHDVVEVSQDMRRAAFLALAALASNLEPIRKKIFNICSVMQHLVRNLIKNDTKTLKSVLKCLLSLSRSVQQLRTSFTEYSVYGALKNLLTTTSNDVLILVLAILCNISLVFSPGKQHFLDSKTIDTLCNLTRGPDTVLRLHGMWILMNMVYQLKDQDLKLQILKSLGIKHLLGLLEIENDDELVIKTLGFLRNLLSYRAHIDVIMSAHGEQIMNSLVRVLEKSSSNRIKEQCLCVLTNIADGNDSKTYIMSNVIVLSYLARVMSDEQAGDLRLASILCITNLAHKEYERSRERREEMNKFGIEEKLKSMLNTNDPDLSDRVRTAYSQFLIGIEDKYVN